MVSALGVVELVAIILAHTAIAALLTRFFRVRLTTRWGGFLYAVLLGPLVLVISTLVLSGVLPLGPNVGSRVAVFGLVIVVPLAIGMTFDYIWMPAPDDVDMPAKWQDDRPSRYEN